MSADQRKSRLHAKHLHVAEEEIQEDEAERANALNAGQDGETDHISTENSETTPLLGAAKQPLPKRSKRSIAFVTLGLAEVIGISYSILYPVYANSGGSYAPKLEHFGPFLALGAWVRQFCSCLK